MCIWGPPLPGWAPAHSPAHSPPRPQHGQVLLAFQQREPDLRQLVLRVAQLRLESAHCIRGEGLVGQLAHGLRALLPLGHEGLRVALHLGHVLVVSLQQGLDLLVDLGLLELLVLPLQGVVLGLERHAPAQVLEQVGVPDRGWRRRGWA